MLLLLALTQLTTAAPTIPLEHYQLDNGLDVILAEDHSTPIVHTNVWYHVGSKDETPGLTGFAHLFEHLMFNGSVHADYDYFDPLQKVGARLNGSTNTDRTNYFETVPAQYLPLALFMESDRMGWLLGALTQTKLDNQRDVVRNERRQRYENPPYGEAWVTLAKALYPAGHPYHHTTIGSHEDLQNASLDDVKGFFRTWYAPNNASLVVTGDFDPAEAKQLIQQNFGAIPAGPELHPTWAETPARTESQVIRQFQDVPHQKVWLTWHSPAFYTPGDAEMDLFSSVLGSGKDSRLYQKLVQELRIARDVTAYQRSAYLSSVYVIQATAAEGHSSDEVVAAIDAVVADLLDKHPLSQSDLDAGVANYERYFYHAIGTIQGKGDLLNRYNYFLGDPSALGRDLKRYTDATPQGVTDVARAVLTTPRVVLHILPEAEAPEGSDANAASPTPEASAAEAPTKAQANAEKKRLKREAKAEKKRAKASKTAPSPDSVLSQVAPEIQRELPGPLPAEAFQLPATEVRTLSNGLQVVIATNHEVPLWQVRLVLKVGDYLDPKGKAGLASVTLDMMDEGAGKLDAAAIAKELKRLAGSVNAGASDDGAWISASGIDRNLAPTLDLWAKVIREPTFPEDAWSLMTTRRISHLQERLEDPSGIAYRGFRRVLYGDSYLGALPTEASYQSITVADQRAFRDQWIGPSNAVLMVGGDIDADTLMPLLEARLGDWKPAGIGSPQLPPQLAEVTAPKLYFIDKPGAAQSVIKVGTRIGERTDADHYALEVANQAFGASFTARVNMNLREDKGYTYGARCHTNYRHGPGLFFCSTSVRTDATGPALQELRREMTEARAERPLTEAEITDARSALILGLPSRFETNGPILDERYEIWLYQLPGDWTDRFVPQVEAVEPQAANDAFRQRVDPARSVWLVVGDGAIIRPGLDSFGLEIVELDRNGDPVAAQ